MPYRYSIQTGVSNIKTKVSILLTTLSVAVLGIGSAMGFMPAIAGAAPQSVVYDNIPDPQPGNVPSVGFEATSTSEFGGQVGLDGSARENPEITVLMSSWACKSGTWNQHTCITNPGSTFDHPVTLNIYDVNGDDSPGALIASETKTFTMPYRPTADDGTNCNGAQAGEWWDGSSCNNGKAFTISYKLNGVTLPDDVIIGVAYNTSHYGKNPIGTTACNSTPQGCPYDSLNVGTAPSPTVGTPLPTADDAYLDSTWGGAYCDNGASGTGTFRLDAGCWTGYLPAFKVEASGDKDHHHHKHHHHKHHEEHHGDNDHHKKHDDYRRGFYNLSHR